MRILTRYLLADLLGHLAFALTILSMLFLLASTFRFLREEVPLAQASEIFPYVIPITLPYTLSVSLLLAVTLVLGRMSADNELIALRTSGVHLGSLYVPVLVLGLVLSIFSWWLQDELVPVCNARQRELLREAVWTVLRGVTKDKAFSRTFGSVYFRADLFDGESYHGVDITRKRAGRLVKITARRAEIHKPAEGNNRIIVDVYDASLTEFDERGEAPEVQQRFDHTRESIPLFNQGEGIKDIPSARLSIHRDELATNAAAELEQIGPRPPTPEETASLRWYSNRMRELEVELHRRRVMALTPLAFLLLSLPLPVLMQSSNRLLPFGAAFGLALVAFYIPFILGMKLGEEGKLAAAPAVWSSLGVLAIPGLRLMWKSLRQ